MTLNLQSDRVRFTLLIRYWQKSLVNACKKTSVTLGYVMYTKCMHALCMKLLFLMCILYINLRNKNHLDTPKIKGIS